MRYPKMLLIFCILLGAVMFAAAQPPVLKVGSVETDLPYSVADVRGNVKRKAAFLPKPQYPRTALDLGADGTVNVEIVLDGEGNVVSAKAVSGNTVFFAVCEETALRTKFRRIEGVGPEFTEKARLTYAFSMARPSWFRIGFDLTSVEDAPALAVINFRHMERSFAEDWTAERELTARLSEIGVGERQPDPFTPRPVLQRERSDNKTKSTITATLPIPQPRATAPEAAALASNLATALGARLGGDAKNFWEFETGRKLARLMRLNRDRAERMKTVEMIRLAIANAPAGVEPAKIEALRGLAAAFETSKPTEATFTSIRQNLSLLSRNY